MALPPSSFARRCHQLPPFFSLPLFSCYCPTTVKPIQSTHSPSPLGVPSLLADRLPAPWLLALFGPLLGLRILLGCASSSMRLLPCMCTAGQARCVAERSQVRPSLQGCYWLALLNASKHADQYARVACMQTDERPQTPQHHHGMQGMQQQPHNQLPRAWNHPYRNHQERSQQHPPTIARIGSNTITPRGGGLAGLPK